MGDDALAQVGETVATGLRGVAERVVEEGELVHARLGVAVERLDDLLIGAGDGAVGGRGRIRVAGWLLAALVGGGFALVAVMVAWSGMAGLVPDLAAATVPAVLPGGAI